MRSRTRSSSGTVAAVTALGAVVAGAVVVGTGGTASGAPRGSSELAQVRAATAAFHDVEVAKDAGYVEMGPCEELPGRGAMGIHYVNLALMDDAEVDPERPEVLLYLPEEDGLRLVAVEWFVPEAAAEGTAPSVLGRSFDGPMAGHAPGMPSHYDLHAWVWAHNPTGTWSAWNPALSCGGSA